MWTPMIGEDAGKVWQILNVNGELTIPNLKKNAEMDDKKLYLALGWLAREGKLKFRQEKRRILVNIA